MFCEGRNVSVRDSKGHIEEKTEVFKRVASEAMTGSRKASVTLSTKTQHSLTSGNSTDRWRAAL